MVLAALTAKCPLGDTGALSPLGMIDGDTIAMSRTRINLQHYGAKSGIDLIAVVTEAVV